MLFFVSVGMLLDPALVWQQIGALAFVVAAIVVGKAAILAGVVRAFGYWNVVPLAVGLTLFQVGEFAFVLARVGLSSGAIGNDVYALTLNAAIVTMVLTPAVSGLTSVVYERLWPRRPREAFEAINLPRSGLSNHVLVAGWGRVGRSVGDALSHLNLPYVLVEFDDRRVRQARTAGVPVIYGDASQTVVLEAAGVVLARALLVTVPAYADVRNIVTAARKVRPDLPIIARADGTDAIQGLYALGIQEVASPEFEAGIEMTRQALIHLNVPAYDILRVASAIRRERYGVSGEQLDDQRAILTQVREVTRYLDFTWFRLPVDSAFDGRTLGELRIRSTTGASVVGIVHSGLLTANPDGQVRLEAGDLVAVLGTREQIGRFEEAAHAPERVAHGA
jgi:CPA2 family monovalent cation:H+ antiporter-2